MFALSWPESFWGFDQALRHNCIGDVTICIVKSESVG